MQRSTFQQIDEAFRARITRYLAGLAGDDQAEDLCQEVFIKVDRGLENFRGEAELATWIYRIATNTYLDHVRGHSFKQHQQEQLTPVDEIDAFTDAAPCFAERPRAAEQKLIRSEMITCVRSYVNQLPEDYRVVMLLSAEEGFKNREIAEILKISLDNVKIRLHRAREKLEQMLQQSCDFYLDERSEVSCDRKQGSD